LPLTAGELDAALAHDRLVLVREPFDEFGAVGDAADALDLVESCMRTSEPDVLRHGSVKNKIILENDAQMGAVVTEASASDCSISF